MTRFYSVALALLLGLSLTACGGGGHGPSTPPTQPEPPPPPPAQHGTVIIGDSLVARWPAATWPAGARNEGGEGQRTDQLLARFQADVLNRRPAVVVIQGGIQDLYQTGTLDDQATTFHMAELAATAGACVVLVDILPAYVPGPPRWGPLPVFNEARRLWAPAYGYHYVRAYEPLERDGRLKAELEVGDGFNLNADGYAVLAPLVTAAIAECAP
jgi:lysophospholipase L1-like esterase